MITDNTNYNINNICAVILAGGLSSRIGGGVKSLIKFNDKIIIDRILENLNNQVQKIIINANKKIEIFDKYRVNIVQDSIKGYLGPLAGIHASLEWIALNEKNVDWLVTVPGDTPFIPANLIEKLLNKAKNYNHKIVLAKSSGKVHPIIGIWHLSLLKSLSIDLNSGTRKILDWANKHPIGYEEFTNTDYDPFFNINYKEDILKAEKIENKFFIY